MGRIGAIIFVALLLGFGAYKIFSSSVDRTDQNAVGKAFLQALKKEDVSRAKKYVVPAEADAWEAATTSAFSGMRTNAMASFHGAIPDEPTFTTVPANKLPKGTLMSDSWLMSGETTLGMRQIDGKWWVSKCSQP